MPYILCSDGRREALQKGKPALNAGELNYQIFYYIKHNHENLDEDTIVKFVKQFIGKMPNYQRYNDMTGALIRCGKEIERRLDIYSGDILDLLLEIINDFDDEIAKYEDTKIISNGDVE